ncbi:sensor histidine kinase [Algibacter pectinivorans]|nr:GAF domain-containing sensor histidine kinase [Algibacter pectinivorans]
MIAPNDHENEVDRIENLKSYNILDTLPEKDYDDITRIAAEICGMPIALISLIDDKRQWFKSHIGLSTTQTPKEYAFCAHAINESNEPFIIQDARKDDRFHDNPLVTGAPNVIFYAGVTLKSQNGLPLGTLCVIDNKPNLLSQSQINSLSALSNQVMNILELRKNKFLLEDALKSLEEKNQDLERFAYVAAHDLKSPLINISSLAELFIEDNKEIIGDESLEMLKLILNSSDNLRGLVEGLLEYSKSDTIIKEKKTSINLEDLIQQVEGLFNYDHKIKMKLNTSLVDVKANKTVVNQVLINLVSNAIKYNDKDEVAIDITVSESSTHYQFYVKDNGPGIALANQKKIFKIFEKLVNYDKFGRTGHGIGLATVKKIVEKSGGTVKVDSQLGEGAKFSFTIKK